VKRKTDNFSKFFEKKKKSGAIKEAFKQEKRAAKRERKDAIERHFEEKRNASTEGFTGRPGSAHASGSGNADRDRPAKTGKGRPPQKGTPAKQPTPATGKAGPQRNPVKTGPGSSGPQRNPSKSPIDPKRNPAKITPGPSGPQRTAAAASDLIPLNKYIAHGGICSRRDAAELIRQGKVLVNGQPVTEPGTRVSPADLVKINGKKVIMSRNFVYILLNKPKDYITTTEDPLGRKTVLDLIRQATPERVYPIGRLDRNTSGVLLLTNDGELAQKLAHPSHEVKKIYHVTLDKVLSKADFDQIVGGVTLEDGEASVDAIAYADARDKAQIGLEIHSGRNRIVRRIFEHLGYDVRGLDRVMYAGLTKKNVQRGKWRLLTEKEVRILKYLNSSVRGPAPAKHGSPAPLRAAQAQAPAAKPAPRSKPSTVAKSRPPRKGPLPVKRAPLKGFSPNAD
jgi:23S rRNA pseudouridine2605 synthase